MNVFIVTTYSARITGQDGYRKAQERVIRYGHKVLNVAVSGNDVDERLRRQVRVMINADLVVVMTGWEASDAARSEVKIARQLSIPIMTLRDFTARELRRMADAHALDIAMMEAHVVSAFR